MFKDSFPLSNSFREPEIPLLFCCHKTQEYFIHILPKTVLNLCGKTHLFALEKTSTSFSLPFLIASALKKKIFAGLRIVASSWFLFQNIQG